MCMQNLKFVALLVPEIMGVGLPEKNWAVPGYAHAPFFPNFLMGFCSDGRSEYMKSVAFPVPEIIGGTQKIWEVP